MSISYLQSLLFRNSTTDAPSEPWLVPEKDTTEVLTLPDGRKLGYSQYGLSTGKPIFYCHGLPGSRIEAGHLHEAALETGARIIATDRPGMGLSTFLPGRTLLDHPKDLEHLASHLKINEYGVMVSRACYFYPDMHFLTWITGRIRGRTICSCLCASHASPQA